MALDFGLDSYKSNYFWENSTFHPNIVKEFRRRKNSNNVGVNYTNINFKDSSPDIDKHSSYKGPLTSWIRAFSNGTGEAKNKRIPTSGFLSKKRYEGLSLDGSFGFTPTYGLKSNHRNNVFSPGGSIRIGRDANGDDVVISDKYLDNLYSYTSNKSEGPIGLPSPGITSVSVINNKDFLTYATVNFECFGIPQLEFITPFFLTPGIYVFVEFGWNLFDQKSMLPLNDIDELRKIITVPKYSSNKFDSNLLLQRYYDSYGNYGLAQGIITDYKFSTRDGIKYDCSFTVTDPQGLYNGNLITFSDKPKITNNKSFINIKSMISDDLDKVFSCVIKNKNFFKFIKEVGYMPESVNFYGNKQEDRIFASRNNTLLDDKISFKYDDVVDNSVASFGISIPTGNKKENFKFYTKSGIGVYSNLDNNDYDYGADDQIWLQLDFIFEYFNLFLPDMFKFDISNVIINAHPNLISCNKNVLIPNPVAPKINYGGQSNPDAVTIIYDKNDNLKKSYAKCALIFNQVERLYARENLDDVINFIHYYKYNNTDNGSASFPFKEQKKVNERIYDAYRFGYLKHIYFNKDRLKQIISEKETIGDILNQVLEEINDSVVNFWKLSICKDQQSGRLTIIDKGLNNLSECYRMKIGTKDSFIKQIDFDVNLSDAQASNILFSTGLNGTDDEEENIQSTENSVPSVSFFDRFTKEVQKNENIESSKKEKSIIETIFSDESNLNSSGILQMSFFIKFPNSSVDKYKCCLNMNPDMKGILRSLLDDGDFTYNSAYANVADNFVVNLKLDGIYGIKVLENFSIENLPKPYTSENILFQVNEITHNISSGKWETNISALVKGVYNAKKIEYIDI